MRPPDLERSIDPQAPAVAWEALGDAAVLAAGAMLGVPPQLVDKAQMQTKRLAEGDLVARAWKVAIPEAYTGASVANWFVNGPFHPLWRWWYVSCIHLRDIPGGVPTSMSFPEATHEMLILSLNPGDDLEHPVPPDIDALEAGSTKLEAMPGILVPPDLTHQVRLDSDEQAAEITGLMVEHMVAGTASPDQDFRPWWETVLDTTARHYREGLL